MIQRSIHLKRIKRLEAQIQLMETTNLYEDSKEEASIPYRRIKPYRNNQQNQKNSSKLPVGSTTLLVGSTLAAAVDAGTYALGYGSGAIGALTIAIVTYGVVIPFAVIGMWFKYREYKNLQNSVDLTIEKEREIYRDILSNEITAFKRLNHAIYLALEKQAVIEKEYIIEILQLIQASKTRLRQFKCQPSDTAEIKQFKEDITTAYPEAKELMTLEIACAKHYLQHICKTQRLDLEDIRRNIPGMISDSVAKSDDKPSTAWKYLLGFAYALGTIVTLAFMAGITSLLATIPGGIVVLVAAVVLTYSYTKLGDKFTDLQNNLATMETHYQAQTIHRNASKEALIHTNTLCCGLSQSSAQPKHSPSNHRAVWDSIRTRGFSNPSPDTPPSYSHHDSSMHTHSPVEEEEEIINNRKKPQRESKLS